MNFFKLTLNYEVGRGHSKAVAPHNSEGRGEGGRGGLSDGT